MKMTFDGGAIYFYKNLKDTFSLDHRGSIHPVSWNTRCLSFLPASTKNFVCCADIEIAATFTRNYQNLQLHVRQTLTTLYRSVFARSGTGEYETAEVLVEGLRRMETGAVEHIMAKTASSVGYLVRRAQLPEALTRDVLHDAVVILIKKIRDNAYNSAESAPATYLIAIARNLIANQLRHNRKASTITLDEAPEIPDNHIHDFLEGRERRELLESLLDTLGEPCARLIRLKYLDGYSDEEILAQNLTHYTTPLALRSKRSKCFQKLIELAAATKPGIKTIINAEELRR